MTQEEYNVLLEQASPHETFDLTWAGYSSIDFMLSFLPNIAIKRSKGLTHSDGANIFSSPLKNNAPYSNIGTSYLFNFISYPDEASISTAKNRVNVRSNEVILFAEINIRDEISIFIKAGSEFRNLISVGSSASDSNIELKSFKTNLYELKSFFSLRELNQGTFMDYVFDLTGTNTDKLKLLNKIFNPTDFRSPIRLENIDEEEEPCFKDFLVSFERFIKGLGGTVENLDAELQIYRSEKHSNGKLGKNDTDYNGEFGFDRYDEVTHGSSDFAKKHFPIIDDVSPDYRSTILSLWAPKSKINKSIPLSNKFAPVTKAKLWVKITQDSSKDISKNTGVIYFDTGNALIKINGTQDGTIAKDGISAPFTVTDTLTFDIECHGNLADFVHVVFRDTDVSGKPIGLITVVPNNITYTTSLQLVDVKFGPVPSLKAKKGTHSVAKPLEDFCNKNSFNQAFINLKVLPGSETMIASPSVTSGKLTDDKFQNYIPKGLQTTFFNRIQTSYKDLFAINQTSGKNQIIVNLNKMMENLDKYPSKAHKKRRKLLVKAATDLVKIVNKRFNKEYIGQEFRLAKTFADADVKEAQLIYEERIASYRNGMAAEAEIKIKAKPELAPFEKDVIEAIKRGERLEEVKATAQPEVSNKIIIFLIRGIAAITDSNVHGNGVAGITSTGTGWVQMFNIALEDKTTFDELTAHEIGHAFGLPHPFEQNKVSIDSDKDYEGIIKNLESNRKSTLAEIEASKKVKPKVVVPIEEFYKSKTDVYNIYLNAVRGYDNNREFYWIDYYFSIHTVTEFVQYEIDAMKEKTRTEAPEVLSRTPESVNKIFDKRIKGVKEDREEKYSEILDFEEGKSKENFLDYGSIKRKSFWYWQWIKMHYNTEPLVPHKNDE